MLVLRLALYIQTCASEVDDCSTLSGSVTSQSIKLVRARPNHSCIVATASASTFSKLKLHSSAQPGTETLAHQIRASVALERHSVSTIEASVALSTDFNVAPLCRPSQLLTRLTRSS